MKAFAGSAAVALFLLGTPLVAEEAADTSAAPPAAVATPASAPSASDKDLPTGAEVATPAPAATVAAPAAAPSPAGEKEQPAAATVSPASAAQPAEAPPAAAPAPVADPPPPPPPPPPITLVLNTDLSTQRLTVIENGKTKYVWPISSGRRGFATQTGTFKPQWASRMWYSRQYEYAPMPHAVFFHRGTAFHGTGATGMLGQPASHGCVRLAPGNAAMLYKLVHKHSFAQTKVVVHYGSRRNGPAVARGSRAERVALRSGGRGGERTARARRISRED